MFFKFHFYTVNSENLCWWCKRKYCKTRWFMADTETVGNLSTYLEMRHQNASAFKAMSGSLKQSSWKLKCMCISWRLWVEISILIAFLAFVIWSHQVWSDCKHREHAIGWLQAKQCALVVAKAYDDVLVSTIYHQQQWYNNTNSTADSPFRGRTEWPLPGRSTSYTCNTFMITSYKCKTSWDHWYWAATHQWRHVMMSTSWQQSALPLSFSWVCPLCSPLSGIAIVGHSTDIERINNGSQ